MTSTLINASIHKLDHIANKYNNICHRRNEMKLTDIRSNTYIDWNAKNNDKDPKYKVAEHKRISKHKNIYSSG